MQITQTLESPLISLEESFPLLCKSISGKPLSSVITSITEYVKKYQLDSASFTFTPTDFTFKPGDLQQFLHYLHASNDFYEINKNTSECFSLDLVFKNIMQMSGSECIASAIDGIYSARAKFYYAYLQTFESEQNINLTAENVLHVFSLIKRIANQGSLTLRKYLPTIKEKCKLHPTVITSNHMELLLQLLAELTDIEERKFILEIFAERHQFFSLSSIDHFALLFTAIDQEQHLLLKDKLINIVAYYIYQSRTNIDIIMFCHYKLSLSQKIVKNARTFILESAVKPEVKSILEKKCMMIFERISKLSAICNTIITQAQIEKKAEILRGDTIAKPTSTIQLKLLINTFHTIYQPRTSKSVFFPGENPSSSTISKLPKKI